MVRALALALLDRLGVDQRTSLTGMLVEIFYIKNY